MWWRENNDQTTEKLRRSNNQDLNFDTPETAQTKAREVVVAVCHKVG